MDMAHVYAFIISLIVVFLVTTVISSATATAIIINCCFFKKKMALSKRNSVHVEMSENVAYATVK